MNIFGEATSSPKAKLMTPIAWNMPGPMRVKRFEGSPFSSGEA